MSGPPSPPRLRQSAYRQNTASSLACRKRPPLNPQPLYPYLNVCASDDDLADHGYIADLADGFKQTVESGYDVSPGIDVAGLVTLRLLMTSKGSHVLSGSGGHRVVLKRYSDLCFSVS